MIVYGNHFHWGVMVKKEKKICAVVCDKDTADMLKKSLEAYWQEEFESIKLNDFEDRHCEEIIRV